MLYCMLHFLHLTSLQIHVFNKIYFLASWWEADEDFLVVLSVYWGRESAFIWLEEGEEEWEELAELPLVFIENSEGTAVTSMSWVLLENEPPCWIFLLTEDNFILSQRLECTKLWIYANPPWECTTFVKLKRRNVSFLCETNISDSSNRHLTR